MVNRRERRSKGKELVSGKVRDVDILGHRDRLRKRFLKDEGLSMHDYEVLELIISGVLKRGDAKPLSKLLIKTFGSYASVLSSSPSDLMQVEGCGESVATAIKTVHWSMKHFLSSKLRRGAIITNWELLERYAKLSMGWKREEYLRIILLDDSKCVVFDEELVRGTVNEVVLYHREILKQVIEKRATGVIMIHNHPSGEVTPSDADLKTTKDLRIAIEVIGAELFDHLIVSGGRVYSFRNSGIIDL